MTDDRPVMFPKLGTTNDLWNDAIEAAARAAELDPIDPGPTRKRIAASIRALKR